MALLDGELSQPDAGRVASHTSQCAFCRRQLNLLRHASEQAKTLGRPLPAGLLEETRAALFEQVRGEQVRGRLSGLPSESAVRAALGDRFSSRLSGSPEQVQAAIQTMTGAAHPSMAMLQLPRFVWFAAGLFGALALAAWLSWMAFGGWSPATPGDFAAVEAVFGTPYKIFLTLMAAAGAMLSFGAMRQFPRHHPLHAAWQVLGVAAVCRLLGGVWVAAPWIVTGSAMPHHEAAGLFIAGPVSLCALGFGLLCALRAYRSLGLTWTPRPADYALLIAGALFTLRHAGQIAGILWHGPLPEPMVMLGWLSDPALLFTLAVAVPLRRIAASQGGGLVAACWSSMAAGTMLTFLGNQMLFLETSFYLPWPYTSITWLIWIPAAAAFTLGPAYQFAANASPLARPHLESPTVS
ncbi:MAG: hypothetical protein IPJ98_15090 [Bryobacterales bacterium]|nr:hypothetical protein [Bryobacterales bacterium]